MITKVTEAVRQLGDDEVSGANLGIDGQALGDMMYFDGSLWLPVPAGDEGDVVTMVGGIPIFTPPEPPAIVLLEAFSISSAPIATFGDPEGAAHFANPKYKNFILQSHDLFPGGGGSNMQARFGTGPTGVIETTNYRWRADNITANAGAGESRAGSTTTDSKMQLHSTNNEIGSNTVQGFKLELQNPNDPSFHTQMRGFWEGPTTSATNAASRMFGVWRDPEPVTSVEISMANSGNFFGEFRLFGVRDAL